MRPDSIGQDSTHYGRSAITACSGNIDNHCRVFVRIFYTNFVSVAARKPPVRSRTAIWPETTHLCRLYLVFIVSMFRLSCWEHQLDNSIVGGIVVVVIVVLVAVLSSRRKKGDGDDDR
jgi:hypothetical protein